MLSTAIADLQHSLRQALPLGWHWQAVLQTLMALWLPLQHKLICVCTYVFVYACALCAKGASCPFDAVVTACVDSKTLTTGACQAVCARGALGGALQASYCIWVKSCELLSRDICQYPMAGMSGWTWGCKATCDQTKRWWSK